MADLRLALQRAEQQQARKEDYLREEISELQQVPSDSDQKVSERRQKCGWPSQGQAFSNHQHAFLVFFHRGFKRQRPGTRNSARVLPQQRDPY